MECYFYFAPLGHRRPRREEMKKKYDSPVILLNTSEILFIVGKVIVSSIDEAVLALVGLLYLFDVDYPSEYELSLTMIHYLFFCDKACSIWTCQTLQRFVCRLYKVQKCRWIINIFAGLHIMWQHSLEQCNLSMHLESSKAKGPEGNNWTSFLFKIDFSCYFQSNRYIDRFFS